MIGIRTKTILGVGAGLTAVTGLYYWRKAALHQIPPKKWKHVGKLQEITFYPVKSCGGINLQTVDCRKTGIDVDNIKNHMFMLVDDKNEIIPARTYQGMLNVQPRIENGQLIVSGDNVEDLTINPTNLGLGRQIQLKWYYKTMTVSDCGPEYEKWFSKSILDKDEGIRLVHCPYALARKSLPKNFKLMTQETIDDINENLENKINHIQFGGNFLIKTTQPPHDEKNWKWVKIGDDAIFRTVRVFSPRAITGETNDSNSFSRTSNVAKIPTSLKYGLKLANKVPGVVKEGDDVYVEDED